MRTCSPFARLLACLFVFVVAPVSAAAFDDYVPGADTHLSCSICHTCEIPTADDLCLNKHFCLRDRVRLQRTGLPHRGVLVMDELENVYDPVYFLHDKHAQMTEMSGGCVNCHHFQPASTEHPACKECHAPESQRGKIEPGLKAAYHQQCLNCHQQWDTETHCEFCHRKKVGGMSDEQIAALPLHLSGGLLERKELIVFETDYDDGDEVPFHHRNHVELYDRDCSVCHRNESCTSCHVHGADSHPLGDLDEIDLHDTCYQCHDEDKGCEQCHGRNRNDLFDHASTGWELRPYHAILQCHDCHHVRGRYTANDKRCVTCHWAGWDEEHFNHGVTGVVLDDVHSDTDCSDCHPAGIGAAVTCDGCHDDGREWHVRPSFGPGAEEE